MTTLYYIHDPMCSWCYGFAPAFAQLLSSLPPGIKVKRLLGGLAPDTDAPMPPDMQQRLQATWRHIQEKIPGTVFNFAFWEECRPRRSTYPACRAVIAAREQGEDYDKLMTAAIQRAYYQQARNPSDTGTLVELAGELGLDAGRFAEALHDPRTREALGSEVRRSAELGMEGMPSLVLEAGTSRWFIPVDYTDAGVMLETIHHLLED